PVVIAVLLADDRGWQTVGHLVGQVGPREPAGQEDDDGQHRDPAEPGAGAAASFALPRDRRHLRGRLALLFVRRSGGLAGSQESGGVASWLDRLGLGRAEGGNPRLAPRVVPLVDRRGAAGLGIAWLGRVPRRLILCHLEGGQG